MDEHNLIKSSYKILAIIPARSGSKSVPNKNIRLINKKPMLAYSIEHARASKYINRIILSTDSKEYAEIGKKYGAEIPFIRPSQYATDTALDIDVFYHALNYLQEKENYIADIVVHLRPTYPWRHVEDIDNMIEIMLRDFTIDSVRSIAPSKENPFKMWTMSDDGKLHPISNTIPECYNSPRQSLPQTYYQNACIDIIRGSTILEKKSMTGKNIHGYLMSNNLDIDTEDDLALTAQLINTVSGHQTFCIDIDGVIAITPDTSDYNKSSPNFDNIQKINKLYRYGNKIILFTARGSATGKDWFSLTQQQMKDWGVMYHELKMGKPAANFYLDDHALTLNNFIQIFNYI